MLSIDKVVPPNPGPLSRANVGEPPSVISVHPKREGTARWKDDAHSQVWAPLFELAFCIFLHLFAQCCTYKIKFEQCTWFGRSWGSGVSLLISSYLLLFFFIIFLHPLITTARKIQFCTNAAALGSKLTQVLRVFSTVWSPGPQDAMVANEGLFIRIPFQNPGGDWNPG